MQVVRIILVVIQYILCIAVTVLAMMQSKDDAGMSSTITGSYTNNFFEKNKGRTKEGMLKRWTINCGVAFVISTIATSIIYIA